MAKRLTRSRMTVLVMAANGATAKEIARELGISPRTAEHHLSKTREFFETKSMIIAIIRSLARGILELDGERVRIAGTRPVRPGGEGEGTGKGDGDPLQNGGEVREESKEEAWS